MEQQYKYLIQRRDDKRFYRLNCTGFYGHTFGGKPFGNFPDPSNDWTDELWQAWQFDSRQEAEDFMEKVEFLHDIHYKDCDVTLVRYKGIDPLNQNAIMSAMKKLYEEPYWTIECRLRSMFEGKQKIVDGIADAIPLLAEKIEKAKQELLTAQENISTHNDNRKRLEDFAIQIGYTIDWNKKAIVKEPVKK